MTVNAILDFAMLGRCDCPVPSVRFVRLSSSAPVTSTLAPAGCKGNMTVKREPRPTELSTRIPPPISATRSRAIVVPRPVPPKRRLIEASAWTKGSKIRSRRSGAIPIPVSTMSMRTPGCNAEITTFTEPCSVNFTALPTRLFNTWRTRSASPCQCVSATA